MRRAANDGCQTRTTLTRLRNVVVAIATELIAQFEIKFVLCMRWLVSGQKQRVTASNARRDTMRTGLVNGNDQKKKRLDGEAEVIEKK